MAKEKGYGSFVDTFGALDDQFYDSSSEDNAWSMSNKAKKDAAFLRDTNLGNANHGGRPFGK
jgi:hypothetical protein